MMKLYIYDHCPFCCRARMIFGLKNLPVETNVLLETDAETPTRLVGRKIAPILEKEDGSHMTESMDIVRYIDAGHGEPLAASVSDSPLKAWHDSAWPLTLDLAIPRLTRGDFPELATPEARAAFRARETRALGDLDALMARTPELAAAMDERLVELNGLLAGQRHLDGDDFLLYPLLRMLSIVKAVSYPPHVKSYMERMEQRTGVKLHFDQAA